ncbi:hypothetical protein [Mycobacteroides abscessus]|uniref:hypothetical protein n=1 Tax=Mycobacteroides abscessus TaxID=36809 RepID=UPI0009293DDB|nr:hypothetical protein [Mycobacteroides abscessus]QCO29056.1 hypothetical protein CFE69_24260 [Mycobacteroides abscessus subsp. massiliense]SHY28610.1 Uncharacterised protein [Mycobacteroides abscessus subsp. abscessus]SIK22589.1 Uncharacterised protein [Mycobacteroides abscessus subsp. abscessus]SIM54640.1 Uncharacterised protein [Mycobacteroides abscessus subsp. abscessus]SKL79182.1 Uncharacterised protein [Mycobacteroides abscessus subsp. massiliense]
MFSRKKRPLNDPVGDLASAVRLEGAGALAAILAQRGSSAGADPDLIPRRLGEVPKEVPQLVQASDGQAAFLWRGVLSQGLFFGGLAVMIAAVAVVLITGQWSPSVLFLTMGAGAMYWALHVDTSRTEYEGPGAGGGGLEYDHRRREG